MNTLAEARAEANAAERLVCLLAFEIAKLNKELMGERRARAHGFRLGLCAWNDGAPPYEHSSGKSVKPGISVRHLPPLTDAETLPPSRCQREAVRQHKPRNGLAPPFSRRLNDEQLAS